MNTSMQEAMLNLGFTPETSVVDVFHDDVGEPFLIGRPVEPSGEVALVVQVPSYLVPEGAKNIATVTNDDITRLQQVLEEWGNTVKGLNPNSSDHLWLHTIDAIITTALFGVGTDTQGAAESRVRLLVQTTVLRNLPEFSVSASVIRNPVMLGEHSQEMVERFGNNPIGHSRLVQFLQSPENVEAMVAYYLAGCGVYMAEQTLEDQIDPQDAESVSHLTSEKDI